MKHASALARLVSKRIKSASDLRSSARPVQTHANDTLVQFGVEGNLQYTHAAIAQMCSDMLAYGRRPKATGIYASCL